MRNEVGFSEERSRVLKLETIRLQRFSVAENKKKNKLLNRFFCNKLTNKRVRMRARGMVGGFGREENKKKNEEYDDLISRPFLIA